MKFFASEIDRRWGGLSHTPGSDPTGRYFYNFLLLLKGTTTEVMRFPFYINLPLIINPFHIYPMLLKVVEAPYDNCLCSNDDLKPYIYCGILR